MVNESDNIPVNTASNKPHILNPERVICTKYVNNKSWNHGVIAGSTTEITNQTYKNEMWIWWPHQLMQPKPKRVTKWWMNKLLNLWKKCTLNQDICIWKYDPNKASIIPVIQDCMLYFEWKFPIILSECHKLQTPDVICIPWK